MCSLNCLQTGDTGIITKIEDHLEIKNRLLDIGFTKGSAIECLMKASFNGPIAYKIKNTVIALRECDSRQIQVEIGV